MSDDGLDEFLAGLLTALGEFFEPISDAAASPTALRAFLRDLGWSLDPAVAAVPSEVGQIAAGVIDLAEQAPDLLGDDDDAASAAAEAAVGDVVVIAAGVGGLSTVSGLPAPFQDHDLPERILNLLVYDYLGHHRPRIFALLRLIGVLDERRQHDPPTGGRIAFVERRLELARIGTFVTDPGSIPEKVYHWGKPEFDADLLLQVLERVARAFGLGVSNELQVGLEHFWDAASANAHRSLVLPAWSGLTAAGPEVAHAQLDLVVAPIPAKGQTSGAPVGIALFPRFAGEVSGTFVLAEGLSLTVDGKIEDEAAVVAEVRPTGAELVGHAAVADIEAISASARFDVHPADPFVVIGSPGSSRLEIAKAHAELGIGLELGKFRMRLGAGVDEASVVIDFGKGDGFLQKLLGGEPQRLDFGAGVAWSNTEGLRFNGTATVRLELPVHLDIAGVVQIETIHVALGGVTGPPAGASLEVSVTGGLTLGPIAAQVDRLGVATRLVEAADHKGALGDLDLQFGFKPPNGLGFVVDAGPVKGGGYVGFDWEAGEYSGILQLEVADTFAIKAIGILATKMPDGRRGFSMVMIITAEFPPIQLGYGFSLNGVGGALGINRTMNRQFLTNGIHSGVLESILFPPDPVAHATEVISNLKQAFPIAEGRFMFGPMIKLAWGSSIITLEVGILLELPMPVRLALLGRFQCALPEAEDAVLLLQLDILGFVDFGTGDISIDATLFGSKVAAFAITGGFALRINVGASPAFALSAGGFHPRFSPPPDFPKLERLGISLSTGENPRLRLESYFAVTTNTVQTGARADFYVGADLGALGSFSAQAEMGFDALFHFGPFWFIVEIYGSASIELNGADLCSADLRFTLEGATPWHVYGHAIVHFFGDHELAFDRTFGDPPPPQALPAVDVAKRVRDAIALETAWGAQSPSDAHPFVTLRDPGTPRVLLHPLSELSVHQRVAPLKTQLDQFGTGPIDGSHTIAIDAVTIEGMSTEGVEDIDDTFVPGQFFAMTDDEKFRRPAFERLPAGVKVKTAAFSTATAQTADQHYVTITVDDFELAPADDRLLTLSRAYRASDAMRSSMVEAAAASRSDFSSDGRYAAPSQGIAVSEPGWAIADRDDLSPQSTHASYTEAVRAGDHVVADFEVVR
jgi:hypothetical protein